MAKSLPVLLLGLLASCDSSADPERSLADAAGETSPEARLDAATGSLDAARPVIDATLLDARTDSVDGQSLDASATLSCKVHSKDVWTACGFQVQAGRCYELTAQIDDKWLDLDVPADLSGWSNKSDPRVVLFAPLRRVVQDDLGFYQFAACVDKQLDQCFPVGATTTTCPKVAGELFFFVNDVSGFEGNNVGTATLTFTPK